MAPANKADEVPAVENDTGDEQKDPVLVDTLPDLSTVSFEPSSS